MPETVLYLVRHGETEYNRRNIMQGRRIDVSLNDTGRAQAEALGRRFAGEPVDAVYTSSLRRAIETGRTIAAHHPGVGVREDLALDEMSWGVFEGRPVEGGVVADLNDVRMHWEAGRFDRPVEGGESIADVQRRGVAAIRRIAGCHAGQTVVCVTHGRFLRVVLATLLDGYGLERMDDFDHDNTGVNCLVHDGNGGYTPRLLNCTAHLDAATT